MERRRTSYEEFRAIWIDTDQVLKERVGLAISAGHVKPFALGTPSSWGLPRFEEYINDVLTYEVTTQGFATPVQMGILGRAGGVIPGVVLGQAAPSSGAGLALASFDWMKWILKIAKACGLGGIVSALATGLQVLTSAGVRQAISRLIAALKAWKEATTKSAIKKAQKSIMKALKAIMKKIIKALGKKAAAFAGGVAELLVKITIPGFLAGLLVALVLGALVNFVGDWLGS